MNNPKKSLRVILWLMIAVPFMALSQAPSSSRRVDKNQVYGMYSGLALLMDVHYPVKPNGYGILYISGSGWTAPVEQNALPLKDNEQTATYVKPLVEAGYTVFAINHRAAPRFRYPAPVEDAQRAVRYIRYNAKRFGIRPDRIGASGGSSGGHLVSLLGVLDGKGIPTDTDSVNRESCKVQCIVARATPFNLMLPGPPPPLLAPQIVGTDTSSTNYKTYREASPLFHVTNDDPPFLLVHGDADKTVPYENSEMMAQALRKVGVSVKLIPIPGGGHGPKFPGAKNPPDYLGEMTRWFDTYLIKK